MNRKSIITAVALSVATTAALAQSGPDFSPMKPGGLEEQRAQSPAAPYAARGDVVVSPEPPVTTQNPMLDAYEQSATPAPSRPNATAYERPATVYEPPVTVYEAPATVYESRPRARVQSQPPRQSTIGNGLFDRRGPNDFGS